MPSTYLVALGSNRRHHLYGFPHAVLRAAMEECAALGTVTARSAVIASAPIGPARRRFANAACLIDSDLDPPAMLAELKRIEREFGRRRGQRWGDRVLDLDIVLWSGGRWSGGRASRERGAGSRGLQIPHPAFRERAFVLGPACDIADDWRDPGGAAGAGSGGRRTLRQLNARLTHPRPLPR